ncbi:hypothetical protein Q2T40_15470 [Winogradskyella maritima]|uniref:Tetratricopeptide repeat protein n=1 Tax=Winogradskyella maritima TaxID=1517766 RepID=A0ABV8AG24_9FLAO|nr:hypothetical protein [Winogradskyella maritima]
MKTKITLVLLALVLGFNMGHAQQDEECMTNLQIFAPYAKAKKYDDAYGPWKKLWEKCPQFNQAIYAYADNILEHKIENSTGAEQLGHINDLLKAYTQYNEYFSSKMPLGKMLVEKAQLSYKYRKELGKSDEDLYNMYNEAFTKDVENFTSPQGLYTYYSLMVDLFDAGKKQAQEMFDKYDDVMDKIETEIDDNSKKLNKLVEKEEAGTALTSREGKLKRQYEQYLEVYDKITGSMDQKLGNRATCEVLIPLYQKDFEQNKNDGLWLQRAMNRLYNKGCKDDPMFLKVVQQKNTIEPSADTAFYLYLLTDEQKYFDQTVQLETDPIKKAKLYKKIANDFKKRGSYGKARQYYREAMQLNPSDGSPHIQIAIMYAASANSCGDDNFSKRAVFWLAANEAERAGSKDSRLRSTAAQYAANYRAKAPTTSEIFSKGNKGQTISIGCWIGGSVRVP